MTVVSPRIRMPRFRMRDSIADRRSRRPAPRSCGRHRALPRPPTYVILCATVGVLNIVGLVMILSASSVAALSDYGSSWYFFDRQLIWARRRRRSRSSPRRRSTTTGGAAPRRGCSGISVAGLVVVLVPGVGIMVDGSRRWLGVGTDQRAADRGREARAAVLRRQRAGRAAPTASTTGASGRRCSFMLGVLAGLVMLEPDLDSAIVLALIGFALLDRERRAAGTTSRRSAAPRSCWSPALAFAAPYRRARMFAFLHPWKDQANTGYQIAQSLIALGSGGVSGVGLGAGRAKWMFLPERAHRLHLRGHRRGARPRSAACSCSRCSPALGLVGFRVARRAPDRFGMLLAAGVTAWIVGQAAINLGAVVGLLPVSGITAAVPVGRRLVARDHDARRGDPRQRRARAAPVPRGRPRRCRPKRRSRRRHGRGGL